MHRLSLQVASYRILGAKAAGRAGGSLVAAHRFQCGNGRGTALARPARRSMSIVTWSAGIQPGIQSVVIEIVAETRILPPFIAETSTVYAPLSLR